MIGFVVKGREPTSSRRGRFSCPHPTRARRYAESRSNQDGQTGVVMEHDDVVGHLEGAHFEPSRAADSGHARIAPDLELLADRPEPSLDGGVRNTYPVDVASPSRALRHCQQSFPVSRGHHYSPTWPDADHLDDRIIATSEWGDPRAESAVFRGPTPRGRIGRSPRPVSLASL